MDSYEKISEEDPFLEDASLDRTPVNSSSVFRSARRLMPIVWHVIILITYTCTYVIVLGRVQSSTGTALTEINNLVIRYVPEPYDDFEKSPYAGLPSPSIDAAWHRLLEHTTIRVTAEELRRNNQTSVELPEGGGYMAWLGVYHELHCIKMVRQWVYREHYHPNLTDADVEEWSIHADHCLDILRSAALCHADTTLTTFGWANKTKPMLNTRPIDHKCVSWNALTDSVQSRTVGKEEMAALVNPLLQ